MIAEAPRVLMVGGGLAFEFDLDQKRQVALLLKRSGAYGTQIFAPEAQDLPRMAYAQLLDRPLVNANWRMPALIATRCAI